MSGKFPGKLNFRDQMENPNQAENLGSKRIKTERLYIKDRIAGK